LPFLWARRQIAVQNSNQNAEFFRTKRAVRPGGHRCSISAARSIKLDDVVGGNPRNFPCTIHTVVSI
jgi:hypothetical protein